MEMTPEERFTKIENSLNTMAEFEALMMGRQDRHDRDIQDLRDMQKSMTLAITQVAKEHRRTEKAQQVTEQKLNALIDTVDRIIGKPGDHTP